MRYFQSSLELLVERGHPTHLLLERQRQGPAEQAWLDRMLEYPSFTCEFMPRSGRDRWQKWAVALRAGMEYVHFLGPDFEGMPRYAFKALRRTPPRAARALTRLPFLRTPRGLGIVYGGLAALERSLPLPRRAVELVRRLSPDLMVIGDAGSRGSLNVAFVRAARQAGVRTAACVASWDNLTTRPRMRAVPHRLIVWNETQRREAVTIHHVPEDDVVVTGAANFDQWFDWSPRPVHDFLERVGLDPSKPMILWVGSALNRWEKDEIHFVRRWLSAVRSAPDPALHEVSVLIRPHPLRREQWDGADFSSFGNVAVWPREGLSMPVGAEQKADYYDSIFNSSAVVGINTSAMIEASIIGRPVLTVVAPDHHDSQFGALHFNYLLKLGGGILTLAPTMEAHLADLATAISSPRSNDAAAHGFLEEFVRPRGLDRPATPFVVDALERLREEAVQPEPEPFWVAAVRAVIVAAAAAADLFRSGSKAPARGLRFGRRLRRRVGRSRVARAMRARYGRLRRRTGARRPA